jgi:hypothetical protein
MLNRKNKLELLVDKDKISALLLKLKEVEGLIEEIKRRSDEKFIPQIRDISLYYKDATLLCNNLLHISATLSENKASGKLGRAYKEASEACSYRFNEVMKNLQFHDIIKQKLEHIAEVNNRLIDELSAGKINRPLASLPYTSMICELAALFSAQLGLIQQEYSDSFKEIKVQLSRIREEMKTVSEVAWNESEAAFYPAKQILDLPEHIIKCKTLETELGHRIDEIDSETEVAAKVTVLNALLKEVVRTFGFCNKLSDKEEKRKVIEKLNQTFTMESERQLWHKVLCEAGFQDTVKNNEDMDSSSIELF